MNFPQSRFDKNRTSVFCRSPIRPAMKKITTLLLISLFTIHTVLAQPTTGTPIKTPGSPLNIVPQQMQSQNFYRVSQYLDLGGPVYGYLDIDGDLSRFTSQLKELLQLIPADPEDPQAAMVKNFDFDYFLQVLGFSNVKAMGVSSYQVGTFFHNKGFLLMEGGPKGIFQVGGVGPHPFDTWNLAPAGTDFVFEQDLNLYSVYQMVEAIMTRTMGDMGKMMIDSQLNKPPKPGMPFTLKQIVESLNTRAFGIVRFANDQKLQIPVNNPDLPGMKEVEIPLVDFYLSIDNLGWFVDHAIAEFEKRPNVEILRSEAWRGVPIPGPLPPFMAGYQPYFLHELGTGRMVVISRPIFMNECLQRSKGLQSDPEFKTAIQGLPTTGNGFSYMSTEAFQHITRVLNTVVQAQASAPTPQPTPSAGEALSTGAVAVAKASRGKVTQEQLNWFLKVLEPYNQPIASVYRTQEDGALFVANQPFSHKGNLFMSLAPNPVFLGALFFSQPKTASHAVSLSSEPDFADDFTLSINGRPSPADINNLRQIGIAYANYVDQTGGHIPANTTGLHQWAKELASRSGLNDASLYWLISDPIVQEHPGDVPETVNDKSFPGMPLSLSLVAGLPANAPGTTPIAWTRGLESNGKWAADAPYGSSGGHILFLDGSVRFASQASEVLIDYQTKQPTSDIRKAVPAAATILKPIALTVELVPVAE